MILFTLFLILMCCGMYLPKSNYCIYLSWMCCGMYIPNSCTYLSLMCSGMYISVDFLCSSRTESSMLFPRTTAQAISYMVLDISHPYTVCAPADAANKLQLEKSNIVDQITGCLCIRCV